MLPTAVSQLLEALGKLLLGVSLAAWARGRGMSVPAVSAFAVLGLVIGGFVSSVCLLCIRAFGKRKNKVSLPLNDRLASDERVLSRVLRIAFPITLCASLLGIGRIIDMTLIMRRLGHIGISTSVANEIYGSYTTLALPVFSLVPALVTPISESLIPRLSAAAETGESLEQSTAVEKALRLTALIGMPSSMGITLYSRQILDLIFPNQPEAVYIAAPLLSFLGASVIFSCLITTTNAILQAYQRVLLPIASMAVGAIVKAVSAYFLIGSAGIGELGAPISTLLCGITVVGMNMFFTERATPKGTANVGVLVRPFLASLAAIAISFAVYAPAFEYTSNESVSLILAIACAGASYLAFARLFGAVTEEDIASLPVLDKLYKIKANKYKNKGVKK